MATTNLRRQHDAAVEIVSEIRKMIANYRDASDAFSLSLKLAKLVGVLRIHFAQEDRHLYPLMMQSTDEETRATAQAFVTEMGALGGAFDEYASRWNSSTRIAEAFDGFRQESEAVFNALAKRIERENTILYPLADRAGGAGVQSAA